MQNRFTDCIISADGLTIKSAVTIHFVFLYLHHRFKNMNLVSAKTYRQLLTILLLGLYAFIVTPVQCWHQHNFRATASARSTNEKVFDSFTKSTVESFEGNCAICAHQYAVYLNAETFPVTAATVNATTKNGYHYIAYISSPQYKFLNKGPPASA